MRLAGLRSLPLWIAAVLLTGFAAGCDNPFDPLKSSDKIEGLTYFDFSAAQAKWDSDPESDGLEITMKYYNEFGDSLNFHGKPHKVEIEFWEAVQDLGPPVVTSRGSLLTVKTVEYGDSDETIRIPIEYYVGTLGELGTEPIKGYLLVRIFPPQEYPQKELEYLVGPEVEFYVYEVLP